MKVNRAKTKIVVFRKGGYLARNEFWTFGETAIEFVNAYKYLGLYFSTKLSTSVMVSELVTKAKMKVNLMFKSLWKFGHIPYAVFVKILDCQILPCILYGAEIERVHVFALKRYLNVASQTPNTMVYGETGRYPVFVTTAIKAVKYWLRVVMMSPERHTRKACNMLASMDNSGKETWATWIRTFLCSHGFSHVWLYQGTGNTGRFICSLKGKII